MVERVELEPRLAEEDIAEAVRRIASEIRRDVGQLEPLLVGILKGCFVFMADLVRELAIPCEVDFIRARSYGSATSSSGAVQITKDVETDLAGRHVVVIEDIADTGLTMDVVVERLRAGHPASIRRCALLLREGSDCHLDYVGFTLGKGFVAGYGIDHAERHRWRRDIGVVPGTDR